MSVKDILVDNTIAKNFCNPLDPHYKAFVKWINDKGVLVVTRRLVKEYISTSGGSPSSTSMPALLNRLTLDGRLTLFDKEELATITLPRGRKKKLRSNREDHDNVKAVVLSYRKYALSHDDRFRYDVNHFPGRTARAEKRPQDIPYA